VGRGGKCGEGLFDELMIERVGDVGEASKVARMDWGIEPSTIRSMECC